MHTLRAPQILNGEPVMEMVKSRDGGETERNKFDFIGRHICLGDIGILQERGVDPVNCPECKVSTESDAVRAPERRFAMHIIRYATQPGGFTVASPFSVTLIAWAYSDTIYNKLADTAAEHGDLTRRDLLLGPCQVAQYQKFDIAIASSAAWLQDETTQKTTAETYKANQCKDLQSLIARKVDRAMMEQDLDTVTRRYKQAFNVGPAAGDIVTPGELSTAVDINELLGGTLDADTATAGVPVPSSTLPEDDGERKAALQKLADAAPAKEEPSISFDDLLSNL